MIRPAPIVMVLIIGTLFFGVTIISAFTISASSRRSIFSSSLNKNNRNRYESKFTTNNNIIQQNGSYNAPRQQKSIVSFTLSKSFKNNNNNQYTTMSGSLAASSSDDTSRTSSLSSSSFKLPTIDKASSKAIVSATMFIIIDVVFRRIFSSAKISFPSSLGACGVVFSILLALQNSTIGTGLYSVLQPGATLLAKWLPVFFVPSLITLPLADSVGSTLELLKIATVIVGGFIVSLLSSSFSVVAVRKLFSWSGGAAAAATEPSTSTQAVATAPVAAAPAKKPFSDELLNALIAFTATTGVASIIARKGLVFATSSEPLTSLFLLGTTLSTFVYGARLPKSFTKLIHPLVTCTALTWTVTSLMSAISGLTFTKILSLYRRGGGLRGYQTGAGDALLFLLGPAVVSLAISMYERRKLMKENIKEVGASILTSTVFGLFGTAFAVRALGIISPYLRLSLLSRNITSPLAMAIAGILGADVSLAVSFVVVTGLLGANFGASILDTVKIRDPVARGLGIGAAAHGLGTAAIVNEPDAFPFAAISMALTATAATITVSIPVIRNILVQIALG